MKRLLVIPFIFSVACVLAQGSFNFEEEKHDFGNIKEGFQAKHAFKFTNTGDVPILITNVRASCGCTTPSWPRTPILPGQSGEISALYNSKNRPGAFHKSITIASNAKVPSKVLRINGFTEKDISGLYTEEEFAASPKLHVEDSQFNFGKLALGQAVSRKFEIKNLGKSDLKISNIRSNCNCVKRELESQAIKSGEVEIIKLIYTPKSIGDQIEFVTIQSNDIAASMPFKIILRANVVEKLNNNSILNDDNKITF